MPMIQSKAASSWSIGSVIMFIYTDKYNIYIYLSKYRWIHGQYTYLKTVTLCRPLVCLSTSLTFLDFFLNAFKIAFWNFHTRIASLFTRCDVRRDWAFWYLALLTLLIIQSHLDWAFCQSLDQSRILPPQLFRDYRTEIARWSHPLAHYYYFSCFCPYASGHCDLLHTLNLGKFNQ